MNHSNNIMTKLFPAHAALAAEIEQAGFEKTPPGMESRLQPALFCGKCGSQLVHVSEANCFVRGWHAAGGAARILACPTCIGFSHPAPDQSSPFSPLPPVKSSDSAPPVNKFPKLGVTAIIRDPAGRILLGRKSRAFAPELLGKWVTPGGRVNFGESLDAAIRREILEETGLAVRIAGRLPIQELIHVQDHFIFVLYECRDPVGIPTAGDDLSQVRWFSMDDLAEIWADLTPLTIAILSPRINP